MKTIVCIVLLAICGCSRTKEQPPTVIWTTNQVVTIIDNTTTNAVPGHQWTELEKDVFSIGGEQMGQMATGHVLSVSSDLKAQTSWQVVTITESNLVMKRMGQHPYGENRTSR